MTSAEIPSVPTRNSTLQSTIKLRIGIEDHRGLDQGQLVHVIDQLLTLRSGHVFRWSVPGGRLPGPTERGKRQATLNEIDRVRTRLVRALRLVPCGWISFVFLVGWESNGTTEHHPKHGFYQQDKK